VNKYINTLILSSFGLVFIACGGGNSETSSNTSPLSTSNGNATPPSNNSIPSANTSPIEPTSVPEIVASTEKSTFSNMGQSVKTYFKGYTLQLLSIKVLTENEKISKESVVVYGTIDEQATNALLKINEHYRNSTLTLQVFKNELLVAQQENIAFNTQIAVNFGSINIK